MAIQPGEWEYLYQTTPATQIPWEVGGPDAALEGLIAQRTFPARGTVLDIGCGLGSAAVYLAALGHTVTGIDFSSTAIEKAKRKASEAGVSVTFLLGDALRTDLKRGAFNVIYDRGCLQHLPRERRGHYQSEVQRLLRPKGIAIIEIAQDTMSVDALKALMGARFTLKETTSLTHVERATGIPRFHTVAVFARR